MAPRQRATYYAARRAMPRDFHAVDGEGGNIDGRHEYLLLRAGEHILRSDSPLGTYQCLGFLADLPRDGIYISFAFNYDVTMILRQLPRNRIEKLFRRDQREIIINGHSSGYYPVTVGHGEFDIDYLPSKEFKVRRHGDTSFTVVHDTFTFFQTSFVTALRKWFGTTDGYHRWVPNPGEEQYAPLIEKIAEGKDMRHDFGELTEYEVEYNRVECFMLEQLMDKFRSVCHKLGIKPTKWQGPGNLVTEVFKKQRLPRDTREHVPQAVWEFANKCYVGGRFECMAYGDITQPVYQYDINSAYAASYTDLPCLIHGSWEKMTKLPSNIDGNLREPWMAKLTFAHHRNMNTNTLPVRIANGSILFPQYGRGWFWNTEIHVARDYADLEFHEGWRYRRECDCHYFDWVPELYAQRIAVGKNSGQGKVLKRTLATIYGKLAQSTGHPVYSNPVWAGLIVSTCRATIIRAALQEKHGHDVLMIATDGIFTTKPRDLSLSSDHGDWTLTEHRHAFIVQSGVYFIPGTVPKTRGVPLSHIIQKEPDFRDLWSKYISRFPEHLEQGVVPTLHIPMNTFHSLRQCYAQNDLSKAGTWSTSLPGSRISFDWNTKRSVPRLQGSAIYTEPIMGSRDLESVPYQRFIGGLDVTQRLRHNFFPDDQPDWADRLQPE